MKKILRAAKLFLKALDSMANPPVEPVEKMLPLKERDGSLDEDMDEVTGDPDLRETPVDE